MMALPVLPESLTDITEKVVPELQRRGLFRKEYEGTTLRENLGLARPENRHVKNDDPVVRAGHGISPCPAA
ncbi:hypothetical protein RAA17_00600 [Komagataeibacter rhaeticus]|nr:hypothetical protein [Komagataeibacter rhaeticus]